MSRTHVPWQALALVTAIPAVAIGLALTSGLLAANANDEADIAEAQLVASAHQLQADPSARATQLLIQGAGAGLVAAALQAEILDRVRAAGPSIDQIEAMGSVADGPLTRINAAIRLSGEEAQIMKAVQNIEAAVPLIFIDRLQLTGGNNAGQLSAEIDLSAFAGPVTP